MLTVPLGVLVATLLFPLPQPAPLDVSVNSTGSFAFDWDGNHADGTGMAETEFVEFHFLPDPPIAIAGLGTGDGHFTVRIPLVATVGENVVPMRTSLVGVPAGLYNLDVRLIGPGGNPSAYSTPLPDLLRVHVIPPQTPTGLRAVGN